MIIERMALDNFRQFRGHQELRFAAKDGSSDKNVTVVLGENGRGKTGLYRALMFCLYGEHVLTQDEGTRKEELLLVNKSAAAEASLDRQPCVARVVVELTHRGLRYSVERSIKAVVDDGEQLEQVDRVRLIHSDSRGNSKITEDPPEIGRVLNGVLDRRVREFFLFDGERIEHLTRASAEQRYEVSKGIKCLLDIDALEVSIGALQQLRKYLGQELGKMSTGEYPRVIQRLNEIGEAVATKRERQQEIDHELVLAGTEKQRLDKMQREYAEVQDLVEERTSLERTRVASELQLSQVLEQMRDRVGPSAILLVSDLLQRVFGELDQRRERGEIPPVLRKDLIERILEDQRCICRRDVLPETEAYQAIMEWKNRTIDTALEASAMDLWRLVSGLITKSEDVRSILETEVQRYGELRNELERAATRLEEIQNELGSSDRADFAELEGLRRRVDERIVGLKAERLRLDEQLGSLQGEYERLNIRKDELLKTQSVMDEVGKRVDLAGRTYDALTAVEKEFTHEIKRSLSSEASEVFEELLDADSRRMLRRVEVKEDYSLQVLDPWGKEFLANISAGQRQVASIAFIIALARAAAGGKMVEMPLFMDTPFGKLSWQHRENLIRYVPASAAQWILLATDTELGRREARLLMNEGAWGSFYHLRALGDGSTVCEELDVDQALTLLPRDEVLP